MCCTKALYTTIHPLPHHDMVYTSYQNQELKREVATLVLGAARFSHLDSDGHGQGRGGRLKMDSDGPASNVGRTLWAAWVSVGALKIYAVIFWAVV